MAVLLVPVLTFVPAGDADSSIVEPSVYPVSVHKGVQYGTGRVQAPSPQQIPLLLDLYEPTGAPKPRPFAIVIHGGGFKYGGRDHEQAVRLAQGLASRGIVAASISYRLKDRKPVLSDTFAPLVAHVATPPGRLPDADFNRAVVAAVEDTLQAVKFMRGQAVAYGIDPERVGLVGGSAGAITSNHVAYVLDDHGIERPSIRFVGSLWGGVLIRSRDGATKPESQLETGEAPIFAAHGEHDSMLPVAMSDELIARAVEQRVPNEYFRMEDAGHDPPRFYSEPGTDGKTGFHRMLDFAGAELSRLVLPPSSDDNDGVPDGDGKQDGAEACPTRSGAAPDGCPIAAGATADGTPPGFALRGLPRRMSHAAFRRRGVRVSIILDEPSRLELVLRGPLRGSRVVRAGDVVLAKRSLRRAGGTRTIRLRAGRRLARRLAARARLSLRVTAIDAAGNRTTRVRRLTIR